MMEQVDRVERLLAAILLRQMENAPDLEKMAVLARVGFENQEIAALVGTTPAVVSQRLYEARKKKSARKTPKKGRGRQ